MRKGFVSAVCLLLVVSSCSTTEQGANAGAMFGSIIGSAIGGISGGYRGSDIGTLVGMAGGAAVGAAIGHASEKAREEKYDAYRREREERAARREHRGTTVPQVWCIVVMIAGSILPTAVTTALSSSRRLRLRVVAIL